MTQLDLLRKEIDEIDGQLTALFLRRMEVTGRVGEYKQAQGIPVLDAGRERAVLAQKAAMVEDPARKADVTALYEAVMGISRRQQRRLVSEDGQGGYLRLQAARACARAPLPRPRVLYQGQPGAYADEAAAGFFGDARPCAAVDTWEEIFAALQSGAADYGVLPIENSSTGAINQVYDLLARHGAFIVGEQVVRVSHCLAAPPGTAMDDVKTVYSHEQGLLQCADFLRAHPAWTPLPRLNTAESARYVAESGVPGQAAICSARAAALYGLEILAENICFNPENYTRFVVVSPVLEVRPGSDKISALVVVPHRSGSLHELITVFAVGGLNLLKIESRPMVGRSWEYQFFVDFSGNLDSPGMDGILRELSQTAEEFRLLGNYKAWAADG